MGTTKTVANYGNWVSTRIIIVPVILALVLGAMSLLSLLFLIPAALFLVVAAYFTSARYFFSARGGGIQEKIQTLVLEGLEWDGSGKALDVGCGSASLAISIAKKFPHSRVVGVDSWGSAWEYSKKLCQQNACAEHVSERVSFQKASASALPFRDGEFDAVVSNLVFHEVKDTKDKLSLVKEALRVLKKGGKFALQDLFYIERLFGNPEDLVDTVKGWGIEEIRLVPTKNGPFIPLALRLPFMVGTLGMLIGEK